MRPGEGDYLMVVDSNLGFSKMDAVVETSLIYEVDLTDLAAPRGALSVTHTNPSPPDPGEAFCEHTSNYDAVAGYAGLMAKCHWDYLRVYVPTGSALSAATPYAVPGEWLLSGESVPAQVDDLNASYFMPERVEGIQGFGTLLVVPKGETLETGFEFALPSTIVQSLGEGRWAYDLYIQKQPGTRATPLSLSVRLPEGVEVLQESPEGILQGELWLLETVLIRDIEVELVFSLP